MSNIDELFPELSDKARYPGGVAPRRGIPEATKPTAFDPDWDASPKMMKLKGVDTEFFPIIALARSLGRKPVTVRSWEAKGWLPLSMYRTPAPKKTYIEGKKPMGHRLYTRVQIEAVVAAATEAGVLDPSVKRPDWKLFTKRVVDSWKQTR